MRNASSSILLASLFLVLQAHGQGPPPPPPLQPLNPPPAPAGNPITTAKVNLGKTLFWDEQLSSTRTVSCGTCHQPVTGGADPRSQIGSAGSTHPGPDGVAGTGDDITGSPGVIANNLDGTYSLDDFFGMTAQVTGRYAPSAINAGFSNSLFWDGRATSEFRDPVTGNVVLAAGAALESQAAGPPNSPVEMAHQNRDWNAVANRIAGVKPLAVATSIPTALETWINNRNYSDLFLEAYGDSAVTPARIIMAIATYERILVSNQAPFDDFIAGNNQALTQAEMRGLGVFNGQGRCNRCHGGNRLTDDRFHYIGVRPQNDDLGRFTVTGNNQDRGRFKTPSLRNVALRGEFMHNGRLATLQEVVAFYNRGGDFDAPNKNGNIIPLNLSPGQRADLVAFLSRPLTDPRVAAETGPFDRPTMFAGSTSQPTLSGSGIAGSGNTIPTMVAIEPSLAGSPSFTVGVTGALGGALGVLAIDTESLPSGQGIPTAGSVLMHFPLTLSQGSDGTGFGSVSVPLPPGLSSSNLQARWYITDPSATGGVSETQLAEFAVFGSSAGLLSAPGNPVAVATSSTQVVLNWDAVTGATVYQLFRGPTNSMEDSHLIGTTSTTQFEDNGYDGNASNRYWIVAVGENEAVNTSAVPVSAPDITIEGPASTILTSGSSSLQFEVSGAGFTQVVSLTIRNDGDADLNNLAGSLSGAQSGSFSLGLIGQTSLTPGQSTSVTLAFTPATTGTHQASLLIESNDPDEGSFTISLSGSVMTATAMETWAQAHGLSGDAALPLSDDDGDTVSLVEEYAYNLDPTSKDNHQLIPGTGTSGLPAIRLIDDCLQIQFIRRRSDNTISYTPQFGSGLNEDDFSSSTAIETVEVIDGDYERVTIEDTVTTSTVTFRFGRMQISMQP